MTKVGIADRLFLTAESDLTPQHVACLVTLEIPDGADPDYLQELSERLRGVTTLGEPFNYRLRSQARKTIAPAWDVLDDADIDLDYHYRHSALPKPGGERQLGMLVSRLHSRPLDLSRPLWEFHLIEGLENNRFALYFKIHHALMDGVGGVQRIQQMLTTDPADTAIRPLWSIGPDPRGSAAGGRSRLTAVKDGLSTIGGLGKIAGQMFKDQRHPEDQALAVPFKAPKSVLNGRIGQQRRIATQNYDFQRLRAVSKAAGVTINDVFLAIVGAGLRRYLDELGELPDEGLTAGTPVSVRLEDDSGSTNAFTMTVMQLGTHVADPAERLAVIARSSTLAKQRLQRLPRNVLELSASVFMGPFVAQNLVGLGGRSTPPYNITVSNVPGPLEQQYFAGARLEAVYPATVLYHGVALMIGVFAASGRFAVGFTGDRDSLPHLQRLAVYTGEALAELEQVHGL